MIFIVNLREYHISRAQKIFFRRSRNNWHLIWQRVNNRWKSHSIPRLINNAKLDQCYSTLFSLEISLRTSQDNLLRWISKQQQQHSSSVDRIPTAFFSRCQGTHYDIGKTIWSSDDFSFGNRLELKPWMCNVLKPLEENDVDVRKISSFAQPFRCDISTQTFLRQCLEQGVSIVSFFSMSSIITTEVRLPREEMMMTHQKLL